MSVNGVGGAGFNGYAYQPSARSPDPAAGAGALDQPGATAGGSPGAPVSLPGGNPVPGASALQALNGFDITGAVTATMPNGMTFGIYSFAPHSEANASSTPGSAGGSSSGSNTSTSSGPDYGAMEAALEQMVEQFMASGYGATSSTAARSAYQQSASNTQAPPGSTGTVA